MIGTQACMPPYRDVLIQRRIVPGKERNGEVACVATVRDRYGSPCSAGSGRGRGLCCAKQHENGRGRGLCGAKEHGLKMGACACARRHGRPERADVHRAAALHAAVHHRAGARHDGQAPRPLHARRRRRHDRGCACGSPMHAPTVAMIVGAHANRHAFLHVLWVRMRVPHASFRDGIVLVHCVVLPSLRSSPQRHMRLLSIGSECLHAGVRGSAAVTSGAFCQA